jgi:deoxyribonuclease-4
VPPAAARTGAPDPAPPPRPSPDGPRVGVHLALRRGLRRAAERAGRIGARTVQVFVDNPTAWKRRTAPPRGLDDFRSRLRELDVAPVAVHASYLVNLAGPDPAFRASSIDVLVAEMAAAAGYGARIVNVHTGSHRDTSVEAGIERVASAVADVLRRARRDSAGAEPMLTLENAAGGGWSVGSTIGELAAIAERAAAMGVADGRLGFCLDVAHAWGAGVAMDDPDSIDAWLATFDHELGLGRLVMIHLNDSRSERGSRTDRHEHVGAGRIGPRGLAHLLGHPRLREIPFVLETPGMDEGYDAINLDRCRALLAGEPLERLPEAAFRLSRRAAASAPADDDVDERARPGGERRAGAARGPARAARAATSARRRA